MVLCSVPQPSQRRDLAERIARYSRSRVNAFTRNDLQKVLQVFGKGVASSPAKAVLLTALFQLQADLHAGTVDLEAAENVQISVESQLKDSATLLLHTLREASLHAWVMKPLVSTAGMKEGSRNEVEVLRRIPGFLSDQNGAYCRERAVFDGVV